MAAMAMRVALEAMTDLATSIGRPSSATAHRLANAIGVAIQDNVTAFLSGMNRPGDIAKALEAGKPFGVEVNELSGNALKQIAKGLGEKGGSVFVDSGAFTLFTAAMRGKARNGRHTTGIDLEPYGFETGTKGEAMDFRAVLARYEELVSQMQSAAEDAGFDDADDPAHAKVMLVMPDVVGDQSESIAMVASYAGLIRGWQGMKSVRPIIPIQRGDAPLADAYDAIVKLVGDDFIVGIPSSEEAVSNEELEQFIRARGDKIEAIHILGAASGKRLDPKIAIIRRFTGNRIEITADANMLRSSLYGSTGRDAAMSKALSHSGKRAVTDRTLADYGAQTSLFDSMNSSDDQMTAFPLQKTLAAVIAFGKNNDAYDAGVLAESIGVSIKRESKSLKRQNIPLDKVLVKWKPRFRDSRQPQYPTVSASMADAIFHHVGDIDMLQLTAQVRAFGQEPPEWARKKWEMMIAAKKAGYSLKRVKFKSNTGVIFVKDDMVLTVDGAERLASGGAVALVHPDMPEGAGYANMIRRKILVARAFAKWIAAYGDSDNQATITRRLVDTGADKIFKVGRFDIDKERVVLDYYPKGSVRWSLRVGTKGDWPDLRAYILRLSKMEFEGKTDDEVSFFDSIDAAAHEAATSPRNYLPEPTDGQKLAGSYKMGRIRMSGVDIAIENPQGSVRSGIGFDGQRWANTMQHHYGYINGSTGADGDHIDVFVQPGLSDDYDGPVYVIDQIDPETGDFDEHKVIIGATSMQQAKAMYLANYDAGWQGCGDVTMMTWPEFREWIASGDTTGPVGEAIESGYDSATGWIGVDLDGTLAKYKGWKGNQNIGSPVAKMVGRVKAWLKAGKDVRIFTARAENKAAVPHIEAWCEKVFGQKLPVTNKKDSGMVQLWDDRAVSVETNTGRAVTGFDDIRIGGGLSSMLEAITAFDGSHARAMSLSAMLGLTMKDREWEKFRDEVMTSQTGGGEVDLFGEPIMPPEDMGGDLFGDEPAPQHLPIDEIPVHEIGLSADVPQFKSGADDETGVVEPLGGKFDRTGVAPIQLWRRRDGRYEVISGRHRLDLARRSGEKTIPSQVHHEDRGFDARRAAMLDAELNIRDGQGKVRDYIDYFTHSWITEADAEAKGLIARHIGQRAFAIATQGSEDLIAAHKAEIISDQAAADIAGLAPGNAAMQAVGIRAIQEGKPIQTAVNTMRAVMALARESGQVADTMDLFGFDDSALREAEAMAKLASRKQRQVGEQLAAIKGAAKRPELARKHGVAVDDPEAVRNRVVELTALKQRWDNWSSHSDLLAEIRAEISKPGFDSMEDAEEYWHWLENGGEEQAYFDAAGRIPAASEDIEDLEQARSYWRLNFAGSPKSVNIRYRGKQYLIHVAFVSDHAYTAKNPEWVEGRSNVRRVIDLPRAQAMDNIWKVLQTPDAITWSRTTEENKQYDAALSAEDRIYGRVVLAPTPTAEDLRNNECTHFEFVSWHLPGQRQHEEARQRGRVEPTNPVQLPKAMRKKSG